MPAEIPSPHHDDGQLAARIRAGDQAAFTQLVMQFFNGSEYVAYRLLHSRDAAKDCVQSVLASVWERRTEFRPVHSVRSYLYGAVRKRALMELRAQRVRYGQHAADWPESGFTEEASMRVATPSAEREILDRTTVAALLAQLPDRSRLIVQLRYLEQMPYTEIAEVMEMSVGAVEQVVIRALGRLRDGVKKDA